MIFFESLDEYGWKHEEGRRHEIDLYNKADINQRFLRSLHAATTDL